MRICRTSDNARIYAELKRTFWQLIGMSPWTKARNVGFKTRESLVEQRRLGSLLGRLLLTFYFEEQRLIGFLSRFLNGVDF